jgi:hypothetical protein
MLTSLYASATATTYNFGTGSSIVTSEDGTTATLHVGAAGDFKTWYSSLSGTTTPTQTDVNTVLSTVTGTLTVKGNVNGDDLSFLNAFGAETIDLCAATGLTVDNMSFGENTKAKYVILPRELSAVKSSWFTNYTNLQSAISYKLPTSTTTTGTDGKTTTTYSNDAELVAYVNVAGTLHDALCKSELCPNIYNYSLIIQYLKDVTLSGNLLATDIAMGNSNITEAGHYIGVWSGHTNPGLNGVSALKKLDLSGAVFARQNDMRISQLGLNKITSVSLPTSFKMDSIPSYCLNNCKSLTELCIPGNYKYLADECFGDNFPCTKIYTTYIDADGNGDLSKPIDNGVNTLTLSKNIKYIGNGAFNLDEKFTDVYIMAETAPVCKLWAFSHGTLYGWGGYNSTSPITRASYNGLTNGTASNERTFGVLHFPSGLSKEETKKYTDIDRVYSIVDELQTTDGNGKTLIWPNQNEYNRSIAQANTGYTWNDWVEGYTASGGDTKTSDLDKTKVTATDTTYSAYLYGGWHQFVLVAAYNYTNPKPHWDFSKIKDNNWWTICVPFDLKKSELLTIFGFTATDGTTTYPKVCTLSKVTRVRPNITLYFGDDLVAKAKSDDDVVISAGVAYMIKPNMDEKKLGTNFVAADHVFEYTQSSETTKTLFPICPDGITAVDNSGASQYDWVYKFMGSYVNKTMPANAFYLGWDSKNSRVAYYYQGTTESKNKSWNPYTSIIGANLTATFVAATGGNDALVPAHYDIACSNDEFTAGAKTGLIFEADDSAPTVINGVEIDNAAANMVRGTVYNMNGQQVKTDGTLDGLQKGIYIMNGKKYVVK